MGFNVDLPLEFIIEGKGEYKDPPLDVLAIRERADALDPADPIKADVYLLLKRLADAEAKLSRSPNLGSG
jgi:hypothetical protein